MTWKSVSLPYGAPENVHSETVCSSKRDPNLPKIVNFDDRLIEFAQMFSDAKVLQQLSMSIATASYKLRKGLGQYLDEELL